MHVPNREKCGLCEKFIYIHDVILVCNLDYKVYHAKCLKIDNDTALELQNINDWYCPLCIKANLPVHNFPTIENKMTYCHCCNQQISNSRHRISNCVFCDNSCHYSCLRMPYFCCNSCFETQHFELNSADALNTLFDQIVFNPYNEGIDNDKNHFFDDEIDNYCDSIKHANNTLASCKYYDINNLPFNDIVGTSFYFNNIDGFQSNFNEFRNQISNLQNNFDFYCFNETNLKTGMSHDYTLENYNSHFLYSIDGKNKGSGLAIYYRKNLKFTVNKSLTFRNSYFECLGGNLNVILVLSMLL